VARPCLAGQRLRREARQGSWERNGELNGELYVSRAQPRPWLEPLPGVTPPVQCPSRA